MPSIAFRNATKPSPFAHIDKVRDPWRLPGKTIPERAERVRTGSFQHFDFTKYKNLGGEMGEVEPS